jgi:hypothetical protein
LQERLHAGRRGVSRRKARGQTKGDYGEKGFKAEAGAEARCAARTQHWGRG